MTFDKQGRQTMFGGLLIYHSDELGRAPCWPWYGPAFQSELGYWWAPIGLNVLVHYAWRAWQWAYRPRRIRMLREAYKRGYFAGAASIQQDVPLIIPVVGPPQAWPTSPKVQVPTNSTNSIANRFDDLSAVPLPPVIKSAGSAL